MKKLKRERMLFRLGKRLLPVITVVLIMSFLTGCEAFVRKFTRKPKKENMPREEMVLAPEEYKGPETTKEEQYREYFLLWKSWQDEIIAALVPDGNHKKQLRSTDEAIKNLSALKPYLDEEKQKKLDGYLVQMAALKDSINEDTHNSRHVSLRRNAELIKRNVLRDFSYKKIRDSLI
jgi:hypothetical protein